MQIARDNNGHPVKATPTATGNCPTCDEPLTPKCGDIVVWHWAHQNNTDCDPWAEGETPWHAAWKNCAPLERQEVPFKNHRADVIAGDKTICEIQHSTISTADITNREAHYGNMRWIFDATTKDFDWEPMDSGKEPFKWKIHRKHTWHAIGACSKRVMLDFGTTGVLSCEKINTSGTWAWGFLYPQNTIARWIAGPGYRAGWDIKAPK